MGETENNIKIFVKSNEEFVVFEEMTNQEFLQFCLNESDRIIKDLRIKELNLSYSQFSAELSSVLQSIKLSIYFVSESTNPFSKVLLSTLNSIRGQIKQYFETKFSDLINWREPSFFDKFFNQPILPNTKFDSGKKNDKETSNIFIPEWMNPDNFKTEEYFKKNKLSSFFKDYKAYSFFLDLKETLCSDNENLFTEYSFIFRKMIEDKFIVNHISESNFRIIFLEKYFQIVDLEKLKTLSTASTKHRLIIYNLIRNKYVPKWFDFNS